MNKNKTFLDGNITLFSQIISKLDRSKFNKLVSLNQSDKHNKGYTSWTHLVWILTSEEYQSLRSQNGTLKRGEHAKYLPMAFTEQGVSMLSSVLNSNRAINVNIQIIRIFTRIRQMLMDNTDLRLEIEKIKTKLDNQDKNMEIVIRYLDELIDRKAEPRPRKRIGFKSDDL